MRLLLFAVLLCGLSIACTSNKPPVPPYDPAIAATQTIDGSPSTPPNDAEWKLLWEAVEAITTLYPADDHRAEKAARVLRLMSKKEYPDAGGGQNALWYDGLRYLCENVLLPTMENLRGQLLDPELKPDEKAALQKRLTDHRTVYNKWAQVYNEAATGNEEGLERGGLPAKLNYQDN